MELPDAVIDILTSLRNHLQDKCEPPVYVSDRRFMKSVNLLQVAAHADGRDQVCIPSLVCLCIPLRLGHSSVLAQSAASRPRLMQPVRWHEAICLRMATMHLLGQAQSCFSVQGWMCTLQVMEYDCLLLEHVFGQRPDDAQKVKQFVLDTIASDPGLQQTELVFLGLFGRACRVLENRNAQVAALCPRLCCEPYGWDLGLTSC